MNKGTGERVRVRRKKLVGDYVYSNFSIIFLLMFLLEMIKLEVGVLFHLKDNNE